MTTIGDWTQYGWIPDDASSFPARIRLRDAAWMVYYEPDVVVERERAEKLKLRELVRDMVDYGEEAGTGIAEFFADRMRELGIEVD